jgi:hypothetical protein
MSEKLRQRKYEPPRIRDLSHPTTRGVSPMGECIAGGSLVSALCMGGDQPDTCGYEWVSCNPTGSKPERGYCALGGSASEGCESGGIHNVGPWQSCIDGAMF